MRVFCKCYLKKLLLQVRIKKDLSFVVINPLNSKIFNIYLFFEHNNSPNVTVSISSCKSWDKKPLLENFLNNDFSIHSIINHVSLFFLLLLCKLVHQFWQKQQ